MEAGANVNVNVESNAASDSVGALIKFIANIKDIANVLPILTSTVGLGAGLVMHHTLPSHPAQSGYCIFLCFIRLVYQVFNDELNNNKITTV